MTDEQIIEALGDTRAVMDALNAEIPMPLELSSVSVWKARGIPWRYRVNIARIAASRGVLLPANFLLTPPRKRRAA